MKDPTTESMALRLATDASVAAATSRRAIYVDQLTRKYETNDASWRATVNAIRSLDRNRKLVGTRQRLETAMLALAAISIVCVAVEGELLGSDLVRLVAEASRELANSTARTALKSVLLGSSLLLLFALIWRYHVVCQIKVETQQLPPRATFFSAASGLRRKFVVEVLLCTLHMPLLGGHRRTLHWGKFDILCWDQLDVVVFARIYLLGRFLRNRLGLSSSSHDIRLIGALHHVELSSLWFTVKYSFQKFPLESTTALLAIDWLLTSAALNFFERGSNPAVASSFDALWVTMATTAGVGYGDVYPRTLGGKFTIALGAIIGGMVLACLLRVVLIDALRLSPQEQTVLDVAHFYRYVRQRKEGAAVLLQQAWRWRRAKQRGRLSAHSQRTRVYAAAEAFRLLRFSQPPNLAGDAYSNSSWSSSSSAAANMNVAVATRMEHLREQMQARRVSNATNLQQTAHLFRKIAATSSA